MTLDSITKIGARLGNTALAVTAAAYSIATGRLIHVDSPALVGALLGSATLFAYDLDHVRDTERSRRSPAQRLRCWISSAVWVAIMLVTLERYPFAPLCSAVFPLSVIVYARPRQSGPQSLGLVRVKELPLVKPIFVALLWTLLPIEVSFFASERPRAGVIAWATWILVAMTCAVTLCDFKDVDDDRTRAVKSWPIVLGSSRSLRWLHVANVVGAVLLGACVASRILPRSFLVFELLGALIAFCACVLARSHRSTRMTAFVAHVLVDLGLAVVAVTGAVVVHVFADI